MRHPRTPQWIVGTADPPASLHMYDGFPDSNASRRVPERQWYGGTGELPNRDRCDVQGPEFPFKNAIGKEAKID